MSDIDAAFDKAAAGQAETSAPQGQVEEAPATATTTQPVGQAKETQEAPKEEAPKGQADREWDGKPDSLANELKQDPKAIQRAYTRIAMAKAEAEKRLKEFEGIESKDLAAVKEWKANQQRQQVAQPIPPQQLTPEQMELIKSDPNTFNTYVQSLVNEQLKGAAQYVNNELAAIKYNQSVTEWERTLADFGEVHPDMWEMHEAGLFKPILEATLKSGRTLEDAYADCAKIRDSFRTKAVEEAQKGIRQKRENASLPGNGVEAEDVTYASNKRDAFDKAFSLAYEKKQSPKAGETIRPQGRVRVKK